jgi:hypothetical protein
MVVVETYYQILGLEDVCMHFKFCLRGKKILLRLISHQYFSVRINRPPAIMQQYFSLRINQHQAPAKRTNKQEVEVGELYNDDGEDGEVSISLNETSVIIELDLIYAGR